MVFRQMYTLKSPAMPRFNLSLVLHISALVSMYACTALCVWSACTVWQAINLVNSISEGQGAAAKEELHRLEMVKAMRERELENEATLLLQQRANIEAAKKFGKVVRVDE
jgi:hypothetical protein